MTDASLQSERKKTVAYVAGAFPLPSETFVYREVRGLRKRGWTITAVGLRLPPGGAAVEADLERDRMTVYGPDLGATLAAWASELFTHPLRSLRTLATVVADAVAPGEPLSPGQRLKLPAQALAGMGLAHRLREKGVEHIHCHFAHAPTTVSMYSAMQMGVSFSFMGHANDLFQRRSILKKKLRRAAFVACISQWHREWYGSIEPDLAGKYEVIRCGVDVENQAAHPLEASEETALKILTICRLMEKKGIETLIRAAAELNRRGIPARLTIAGDGPDRTRLEKIATELNCGSWLRWLGRVEHSTVPALLAKADVFALPCREDSHGDRDGIPVVLMEAMACETPVVSGDLPAIRELIENRASGLLVDGNDPAGLADKLAMLWGDPRLRARLAEGGKKRVIEEFEMSLNLDRLERRIMAAQNA
jgi:glycosyltransferase involved in cell wall biosynthesis